MTTATIPVTYDGDAKARLDELGLHAVCEQMIEHALATVPNLVRLDVTCPYNEVLGPDQQIVFDAYVTGPRTWWIGNSHGGCARIFPGKHEGTSY